MKKNVLKGFGELFLILAIIGVLHHVFYVFYDITYFTGNSKSETLGKILAPLFLFLPYHILYKFSGNESFFSIFKNLNGETQVKLLELFLALIVIFFIILIIL